MVRWWFCFPASALVERPFARFNTGGWCHSGFLFEPGQSSPAPSHLIHSPSHLCIVEQKLIHTAMARYIVAPM
ncbi:hypothetical protein GE21DRAFT_1002014 [Neurospora crassa]|nr:hypothetical protein GE21DRAFT_1002014 [Neurospora crassa]